MLADYLADNYGVCSHGSDCYWGKNAKDNFNGCLQTGWKGRSCPYWEPTPATTLEELLVFQKSTS